MSTNNTTDNRFKKTEQVVGENGNEVNPPGKGVNDMIFKDREPGNAENFRADPVSASSGGAQDSSQSSKIERDLETKGYSNRATDEELDEDKALREKLEKRGNEAQ